MLLTIKNIYKKNLFVSLFNLLKNFTSLINLMFFEDHIYIQGMDKSHVCLYDIKLQKDWFDSYSLDTQNDMKVAAFSVTIFSKIISTVESDKILKIYFEGEKDCVFIDIVDEEVEGSNKNTKVSYKLPLAEYEEDTLNIPEDTEYDAEFTMNSSKITSIANQMMSFAETINIICDETRIKFSVNSNLAEMDVIIDSEDLNEYSVIEGEEVNLFYSLNYLSKMCLTNKLTENVELGIGKDAPMRIKYDLEGNSRIYFYLAPKIEE